ncbi:WGR domain-containing protein [Agrobacterium rosae]|uniref:WGR domain-containing protein n=1 Tax=Agrobacterium rosae TaxID=1972867 RepID=UPI00097D56D2|nr:WGR domain-containing protein [Agrobacterium rosae]
MSTQPNSVYIERIDAPRNMARYYFLDMTSTLFGDVCLTRTWGRIGCRGQSKTQHFARREDALIVFLDILRRKTVRGYRAPALLNGPVR